jgi:filamentous hemagglutinin
MLPPTGPINKPNFNPAEISDSQGRSDQTPARVARAPTPEGVLGGLSSPPTRQAISRAQRKPSVTALSDAKETAPSTVSIVGFKSDLSLVGKLADPIDPPHPYRVTGHVGYSIDGGKTIFGFGPSLPEGVSSDDAILRLAQRETFPGKVTDDTHVFRSVAENPRHSASTAQSAQYVYKQDIGVSPQQYATIKATHDHRPLAQAMPEVRYGFPFPNTTAFNCATYPGSLGIDLPHPRGTLDTYIPKLAEKGDLWMPESETPPAVSGRRYRAKSGAA